MPDHRTRVLLVRFTADRDPRRNGQCDRFGGGVLFPVEVKRRLATLENATARAKELARKIIRRDCYRPPDLDVLTCSVEVTLFGLRPFQGVEWTLEDGTKLWITEAFQPLLWSWSWQR